MRLQLASPAEHPDLGLLPFGTDLDAWSLPSIHEVSGLHRHVVRLVELGEGHRRRSYVVKELPDHLVLREYRLLRGLDEDGLPTVDVVAAITERTGERDGLLVTRHLDYALPYRSLLSGRGLRIPYLGERLLDALVGLLVRLHLAGFFWGDCSLSNTLFRRYAGALSAFVIDVETSGALPVTLRWATKRWTSTSPPRTSPAACSTYRSVGVSSRTSIRGRWQRTSRTATPSLWEELTAAQEFQLDELWRVEEARSERLHDLGFDVAEMDVVADEEGERLRVLAPGRRGRLPRRPPVRPDRGRRRREPGAPPPQRHATFGAELRESTGKPLPEKSSPCAGSTSASSRTIAKIPPELMGKLQAAEIYHQVLD